MDFKDYVEIIKNFAEAMNMDYLVHENGAVTVYPRAKKSPREEWVEKWYEAYRKDRCVNVYGIHNYTVLTYNKIPVAVATCSKQDKFDGRVGAAVAYARWQGECIPNFI